MVILKKKRKKRQFTFMSMCVYICISVFNTLFEVR